MTAEDILDLPDPAPARPVWLVTLADLALLLVGFFVLFQATRVDRHALASGIRAGFGVATPDSVEPMAVSAGAADGFAAGSAALPGPPTALIGWAREALRDKRVTLRLMGAVDGSAGDVDPATGSGAVLAADRARTVAVALIAAGVAADRISLTTAMHRARRGVAVTTAFAGGR